MSDKNGTSSASLVMSRANKREALALPMPDDDERVCLDQEALVKWMIDKSSPHQGRQQCVIFTLTHDHKVNGNRQITSSRVIKKQSSPGEREEIVRSAVEEFDYEAEETVKHYPDMQRFVVWGYKTEGASGEDRKDDAEFSRSFSVEPLENAKMTMGQAYGDPGTGSIDVVAIVQAALTAAKESNRQKDQTVQACIERQSTLVETLLVEVRENLTARVEQAQRLEEALSDRARRESEARNQDMKTDATWMLFQGAMTWGKGFVERWIAIRERQIGMGAPTEKADAPFIELAKTLNPQQLFTIATALSPDQQRMFAPMADMIVHAMPPEQQEMATALFDAWRESLLAEEQAKKKAASDPGIGVKPATPTAVSTVPNKEGKR